jgi:hypothetical protein
MDNPQFTHKELREYAEQTIYGDRTPPGRPTALIWAWRVAAVIVLAAGILGLIRDRAFKPAAPAAESEEKLSLNPKSIMSPPSQVQGASQPLRAIDPKASDWRADPIEFYMEPTVKPSVPNQDWLKVMNDGAADRRSE